MTRGAKGYTNPLCAPGNVFKSTCTVLLFVSPVFLVVGKVSGHITETSSQSVTSQASRCYSTVYPNLCYYSARRNFRPLSEFVLACAQKPCVGMKTV